MIATAGPAAGWGRGLPGGRKEENHAQGSICRYFGPPRPSPPQDVETLFGPGAELTLRGQDNFMGGSVYTQRVEIQGPKGSIPKVTILGPLRKYIQVEVSATDARKLAFPPVVRESGPQITKGRPAAGSWGPAAASRSSRGVIAAHRHIHMTPAGRCGRRRSGGGYRGDPHQWDRPGDHL